jgi:hypothetical protein
LSDGPDKSGLQRALPDLSGESPQNGSFCGGDYK